MASDNSFCSLVRCCEWQSGLIRERKVHSMEMIVLGGGLLIIIIAVVISVVSSVVSAVAADQDDTED